MGSGTMNSAIRINDGNGSGADESQGTFLNGAQVFQPKPGVSDFQAARISEMMKSKSLDNAPTQSLLSVVNGILDENIGRRNTEIPQRVACLLRKVVQEIERRISTQAEHLRAQGNLYRTREEKYLSRIKILEALAIGTSEESEIVMNKLRKMKSERMRVQEKRLDEGKEVGQSKKEKVESKPDLPMLKQDQEQITQLKKEKDESDRALSMLKRDLEELAQLKKEKDESDRALAILKRDLEQLAQLKKEKDESDRALSMLKQDMEQVARLRKEKDESDHTLSMLKQDMEQVAQLKKERDQSYNELSMLKQDLEQLAKEKDQSDRELSVLKQDVEKVERLNKEKADSDLELSNLKQELETIVQLKKDKDQSYNELSMLKQDLEQLAKEKDQNDRELSVLKQDLEKVEKLKKEKAESDLELSNLKQELETIVQLKKDKDQSDLELSVLKQELGMIKTKYEQCCLEMDTQSKLVKMELEPKIAQQELLLEDSKKQMQLIEANAEAKCTKLMQKQHLVNGFIKDHSASLLELMNFKESIKLECLEAQKHYVQELNRVGEKLKGVAEVAQKYYALLDENRKIYNELQDLKGNIRVYCRIRPFRPWENKKETVIEYIGDNGELTITNSSKGKDAQKAFKFNKVYGSTASQADVFVDTQPLIRTVLDGFNVCIFAYGQTGSGKTYTMTGPEGATKENWGVNYRALDDLFQISEDRKDCFHYEIGVQMVEIYNEQIKDLLSSDGSQKRLGVWTGTQPNGLAVPDASMHPVESTSKVIELMTLGHTNRSVSSTAMNERSSRSHSVVTIHVEGTDLGSGTSTRGSLHLVDLAGSERVDRSEAAGDRLKEAQHINKSLSALGDVIFALAQKSPHVPYRNSKLTQVLQSSLGGRAKTLMFVQVNPDVTSFTETLSTLKFAERVSGVELGSARSNRDGRDVRELMDQVASLKDVIAKKDEEIERLQLLKDSRSSNGAVKNGSGSLSSSPGHSPTSNNGRPAVVPQKEGGSSDDQDNGSDQGSDAESHQTTDIDERLSEVSDADTDVAGEPRDVVDSPRRSVGRGDGTLKKSRSATSVMSPRTKGAAQASPSRLSQVRSGLRVTTALKKTASGGSIPGTPSRQTTGTSSAPAARRGRA